MLNLKDLAEFDGMTADLVRAYLYRRGYQINNNLYTVGGITFGTEDSHLMLTDLFHCLARVEGRSIQDMLTAINPRMMPLPSAELRAKHTGYWLAYREGCALRVGRFTGPDDCLGSMQNEQPGS